MDTNTNRDQHQQLAIEKLTKCGFLEKHQQLAAQGFDFPWRNLGLLKQFDGDVEQVKKAHIEKQELHKEEDQIALLTLEKLGYMEQHQYLEKKGFKNPNKNLRVLIKTQGDALKAEAKITECKYGRHGGHGDHKHQPFGKEEFPQQTAKLLELGYECSYRNAKLLRKHNGDLEAVIGELLKKGRKIKKLKMKNVKALPEFGAKKLEMKEKLGLLRKEGLKKKKHALKLLAMWNGDVQAVLKLFQTPQKE